MFHRYLLPAIVCCSFIVLHPAKRAFAQTAGIFQTYVVLEVDTPGNVWRAGGENADAATPVAGMHFEGVGSLKIVGGEIKSWKNGGGDVTAASLHYRVGPAGALAGDFVAIDLPWLEDLLTAGDQKWQTLEANVDLLDSLSPGNYELELYWKIATHDGEIFDNDAGNNYLATFEIPAVGTPELMQSGKMVNVYPNPAAVGSTVRVELEDASASSTAYLLDVTGKVVHQHRIAGGNATFSLPGSVAPGSYMLRLESSTGTTLGVTKLLLF